MSLAEQQPFDAANNLILKLVSSETIICQVISDTDKNMIIRDPYEIRVHSVPTPQGMRSTVYYADWFLSSKSRIHILRKEHIMSAAIPDDTAKKEYRDIVDARDHNLGPNKAPEGPLNWDQDTNLDGQDVGRN